MQIALDRCAMGVHQGRRMGTRRFVSGVIALAAAGAAVRAAPPVTDSSLVTNAGPRITDADFAGIMGNALIKNYGTANEIPNCSAAIFLMQQCYGGGMLDNIQTALKTNTPWVFGSASTAAEQSWGQLTPAEAVAYNATVPPNKRVDLLGPAVSPTPRDYWTTALLGQLAANPNQTVRLSVSSAGQADAVGPNPMPPFGTFEHPQDASANNGFLFQLNDTRVSTSYDAVLWAGDPNAVRHQNDVTGIYNALRAAWDPIKQPETIKILYGNGTTPAGVPWTNNDAATRANLVTTMGALPLNGKAMFLFYATDHGGQVAPVAVNAGVVPGNTSVPGSFSLDSTTVASIDYQQEFAASEDPNPGFNPYEPYLEVQYHGVAADGTVAVYDGSDLLGYLPAADTVFDFNVPYSDVGTVDNLTFKNIGTSPFTLDGAVFNADGNTVPPTPEPACGGILAIATLGLLARRRR
ncbi:MAG: hypothetical protein JWN24_652 [Phycisphaerales bacterium]|nr:hypothetical protein [Phycisphaerales bacterium]